MKNCKFLQGIMEKNTNFIKSSQKKTLISSKNFEKTPANFGKESWRKMKISQKNKMHFEKRISEKNRFSQLIIWGGGGLQISSMACEKNPQIVKYPKKMQLL